MTQEWPERIWLLPGTSTWSPAPYPADTVGAQDAIEYVRADTVPRWQDIRTAPKDGTVIFAFDADRPVGWGLPVKWNNRMSWINGERGKALGPTHWMPLPPPPKDGE